VKFDPLIFLTDGTKEENVDVVLVASGRTPLTDGIDIEKAGVELDDNGFVKVDEFENTSVPNIYALGDVTGKIELTPVAIKTGRILVERVFNNKPTLKMDYENVPTVVFSHPPCGIIGLSEKQAKDKFGDDNVGVYKSVFVNMFYSCMANQDEKPKTIIKIITNKLENDKVVGAHMHGKDVDEILQAVGIVIKMNGTKKDFDRCVAIHPTASEELVLLDPKYEEE
jgi:glutathione reductase (NADPH)